MVPPKRGSDGSYSSFSSSGSSSSSRNYVDPWDVENAMYVRGKRISFASDPSTFSAASAVVAPVEPPHAALCDCEPLYNSGASVLIPEPLASVRYLDFCPFCDAEEHSKGRKKKGKGSQASKISPPASITYRVPTAVDIDSCEECSAASCASVAPPPPLMLFSNGHNLSAAGLRLTSASECHDCDDRLVSFSPAPRRFSVPTQPKLAYVYESPRARAKTSLPSWSSARERSRDNPTLYQASSHTDINNNRWERSRRMSLALPPAGLAPTPVDDDCDCSSSHHLPAGPHATLLAPPRHPCQWGMARSGHVAIDYTNAWMSLARRIKPSRG